MKTKEEWKADVDKILAEKVAAVVRKFDEDRNLGFHELEAASRELEDVEGQKKKILEEKAGLNLLVTPELRRWNLIDQEIKYLDPQIKNCREKINSLVSKLTNIPRDIEESTLMNFLFQLNKEKF